jgi:segregation and condensation protein B
MERAQMLRILEAILFASAEPIRERALLQRLPDGVDLPGLLDELQLQYSARGVNLTRSGDCWAFRTAPDLISSLRLEVTVPRRLSRAAVETLGIIAYHQPITRAEVEEMRGVSLGRGTLDILLEQSWIKPQGRRRAPGRPVTWGTTDAFLDQFGLESLEALPGLDELKATGLLDRRQVWSAITSGPEANDESDDVNEDESETLFEAVEDDDAISLDEDGRT